MRGKTVRFPFEHAASYAADCARHAYWVMAVTDEQAQAEVSPEAYTKLAALAERMVPLLDELFAIRHELVKLRYSTKDSLSAEVTEGLEAVDGLYQALEAIIPKAETLVRGHRLRERLPHGSQKLSRARTAILKVVQSLKTATERAIDADISESVLDTIVLIESLHDGVPFSEALARERKRWE